MNELAPCPSLPCHPIPYGLVSLWDMINLYFGSFYLVLDELRLYRQNADLRSVADRDVDDRLLVDLAGALDRVKENCDAMELKESAKRVVRLKDEFARGKPSSHRVSEILNDLVNAIHDEGADRIIFVVPPRKSAWLAIEPDPWQTVCDRFDGAGDEIESAHTCYAVNENTACVFHMMRVLELGLAALAAEVGLTFDRQQWHNMIEQIESEIGETRKSGVKTKDKAERLQFLSEAAKEFFYFKDGWRNYVAHNRVQYDEHQAASTIEHVRAFMTVLAKKLSPP